MRELGKDANTRCVHQRANKGCAVHHTDRMPSACRLWGCLWLSNDDTADLSRPDRSHYVIDSMPDFITMQDNETKEERRIPVIQIWCDPRYPDAHRDPALRTYLERRAENGYVAIVRYDSRRAIVLFPPALSEDRQWHEVTTGMETQEQHDFRDVMHALGYARDPD